MTEPCCSRPVTLVLHKLLEGFTYGVTNYSPGRFERLLQKLQSGGWQSSFPSDSAETRQGRRVIVSFDDGYLHLSETLPALMERCSLRPIVFMPTGLLGKTNRWDYSYRLRATPHLDWNAVRTLAALGVVFGSHGTMHRDLTSCTASELKHELENSRKALQDLTGQEIDQISYPFGRCDRRVIEEAQRAGYSAGFTMRFPRIDDQLLALGRVPVYAFDTPWSISRKLDPGFVRQVECFKTDTVNRLSGGTIWLNRLRRFHP
ncbi:MAG: polysaccharide deacetylase family protein [candidate division Zixibacteria bacterium]|nr:polysaccharide deacetylase family protein [candidate division Zixibacteria bacterium]